MSQGWVDGGEAEVRRRGGKSTYHTDNSGIDKSGTESNWSGRWFEGWRVGRSLRLGILKETVVSNLRGLRVQGPHVRIGETELVGRERN